MDAQTHCPHIPVPVAPSYSPIQEWRDSAHSVPSVNQGTLPSAFFAYFLLGACWSQTQSVTVSDVCMEVGGASEGKEEANGRAPDSKLQFKIARCLLCARPCPNHPESHLHSWEGGFSWVHFTDEETEVLSGPHRE